MQDVRHTIPIFVEGVVLAVLFEKGMEIPGEVHQTGQRAFVAAQQKRLDRDDQDHVRPPEEAHDQPRQRRQQ
ncbi:MAG: hypothetical protein Q8P67_02805 [archaeon]|nr:hypothetical protein [archaeon]